MKSSRPRATFVDGGGPPTSSLPEGILRSASHHLEIVSAMESRDPEWAASVMRSHILAAHAALRDDPES
jgi:DNA-binding GntR family transcriptional regulator